MALNDDAVDQLCEELVDRLAPLAALDTPEAALEVEDQARRLAERQRGDLAAADGHDEKPAGDTVDAVMAALWPTNDPPPEWWRTPLGRICARSVGHHTTDAVTHSIAGAILGRNPRNIGTMVSRGHLEAHPDGGVTLASVLSHKAVVGA